ncbi:MAG: arginine--tRNA ligase [Stenotrophobium sp.]
MKSHLQDLLRAALQPLLAGKDLRAPDSIQIDAAKDKSHGDFASNLALVIAKPLGQSPRTVAQALVNNLPPSARVAKVEIAGPGFINFFLAADAFQAVVADVLKSGDKFGRDDSGSKGKILVEFVSANPTGPMHVGHGRGAAYGDTVCNLLAATGWTVWREYYINDAGRQVDVLTISVWLRYLDMFGESISFPARAYAGGYITECAERLREKYGEQFRKPSADVFAYGEPWSNEVITPDTDPETLKGFQEKQLDALISKAHELLGNSYELIKEFALEKQLGVIRETLANFDVRFDQWSSEAALVETGFVKKALARLAEKGLTYDKDGALWMRTEAFGDEKDRVLIKADGAATYFCNDLAYHIDKLDRAKTNDYPPLLMDVWGADHHGYIARVRAAIEALTGRKDALNVQLIQFVTLSSGKMGKRSGNFVTLQDLIDEAGTDATRFFYLMRSHEQHLEFNIDLARSQSNDNPVFYVQYAHARVCSVFAQFAERGGKYDEAAGLAALHRLDNEHEKALLVQINRFPEIIRKAAAEYEPHTLAFYLKDGLADAFHSYYNAHKFIVDDAELQSARLALISAARQVLRNGLALLGVSAPEKM